MDTLRYVGVAVAAIVLLSCTALTAAQAPPGDAHGMPCIQKLLPCQPYLHAPNPPATCCIPLKEIVEKDVTCLCFVFNNPDMLRSLNLTKANALDLPKACGANADVSLCKNAATPPTTSPMTPTMPMTPPASTNESSSTGGSSTGGSTAGASSGSPASIVSFIGLNFVLLIVATVFF